ncbi:MAG: hypothetical protein KAJ07_04475 [Planctomycetes bacterium]|nr:hypothetical protein [Planctomycetota bacterium]
MPQFDDPVQEIKYAHDRKLSKLAVLSFLLMLGGFWIFFGGPWKSICAWLPAMSCGAYSWVHIRNSGGALKGKFFAVAATIVPLICIIAGVAMFFVWRIDAAPISNDLTVADLYCADDEYAASFDLLGKLGETDTKVFLGFSERINSGNASDTRAWLGANRSKILDDWEKTADARSIIERLDEFVQIADMTDPNWSNMPQVFSDFMNLSELYSGYACLQNELGFGALGAEQLIMFDSVLKKIKIYVRSGIFGEMCSRWLSFNIITANYIVNCPGTDQKTLKIVASHFRPVANDYTSLRNGAIFDYLHMKSIMYQTFKESTSRLFKPNSTCRVYRNYCDDSLAILDGVDKRNGERISVWPEFYPKNLSDIEVSADADTEIPESYRYYNPYGASIIENLGESFGRRLVADINYKVLSDLFMISLNKRLGKEVSLKARAYSDEYIIDVEKKMIFSPGPDGENYTEDDIKLFIEPAVLKL